MYKIIIRSLIFIIIFLFLAVLLSPFIALFLPKKLRNHAYAELVYQVIADKETKDCQTTEDKILKLFNYVRINITPSGVPYEGKPLDYLVRARGWCDYQARTLNSLLGRLNILSRYAMLIDQDGISPHTVNEIFIDGKWAIFDTLNNFIFKNGDEYLSVTDLNQNPDFITQVLDKTQKHSLEELFLRTLPFEKNWRRSTPRVEQYHIIDYLVGIYNKIFGRFFTHFYQDLYLKVMLSEIHDNKDEQLFLRARHYHLLYREDLASICYDKLIKNFSESRYVKEARRFKDIIKGERGN